MRINKNKIKTKQTLIILIAFMLGIFIAIYLKSTDSDNVYISLEEKRSLENDINNKKMEISSLKKRKEEYEKSLKAYEDVVKNKNKSIGELMNEELDYLKVISGYSSIIGSGVIITIKDSERELSSGETPNDLLVHDIDILRILNDLKKAGAKGITINGERVIPTSEIKCSGATITVNKTTYGQPFIIKAIGNTESLMASINAPESYANLLRSVYGIYINIEENEEITLNFYENNK
ncbi:DUF881 domain-containing protein [Romboutsia ilealis]|uniref:DUF881 domain-containing protein n=2 Tax=Romboutsia faecis TaxID=2764597 RepID=A0ABR7JM03_9FIRM|nr:DUF881 domain-containing protein [Romboutsia faecis]MRN23156.1 DUF881 domain-containing protein [Romboutsia ilealis]